MRCSGDFLVFHDLLGESTFDFWSRDAHDHVTGGILKLEGHIAGVAVGSIL